MGESCIGRNCMERDYRDQTREIRWCRGRGYYIDREGCHIGETRL
jgi:hypothetical protein